MKREMTRQVYGMGGDNGVCVNNKPVSCSVHDVTRQSTALAVTVRVAVDVPTKVVVEGI